MVCQHWASIGSIFSDCWDDAPRVPERAIMYYIHGVVIVSGTPRDKERSYYIIIFFIILNFVTKFRICWILCKVVVMTF